MAIILAFSVAAQASSIVFYDTIEAMKRINYAKSETKTSSAFLDSDYCWSSFRLGERWVNVATLVSSGIKCKAFGDENSKTVFERYYKRVGFLPFRINRLFTNSSELIPTSRAIIIIWILLCLTAIFATFTFFKRLFRDLRV